MDLQDDKNNTKNNTKEPPLPPHPIYLTLLSHSPYLIRILPLPPPPTPPPAKNSTLTEKNSNNSVPKTTQHGAKNTNPLRVTNYPSNHPYDPHPPPQTLNTPYQCPKIHPGMDLAPFLPTLIGLCNYHYIGPTFSTLKPPSHGSETLALICDYLMHIAGGEGEGDEEVLGGRLVKEVISDALNGGLKAHERQGGRGGTERGRRDDTEVWKVYKGRVEGFTDWGGGGKEKLGAIKPGGALSWKWVHMLELLADVRACLKVGDDGSGMGVSGSKLKEWCMGMGKIKVMTQAMEQEWGKRIKGEGGGGEFKWIGRYLDVRERYIKLLCQTLGAVRWMVKGERSGGTTHVGKWFKEDFKVYSSRWKEVVDASVDLYRRCVWRGCRHTTSVVLSLVEVCVGVMDVMEWAEGKRGEVGIKGRGGRCGTERAEAVRIIRKVREGWGKKGRGGVGRLKGIEAIMARILDSHWPVPLGFFKPVSPPVVRLLSSSLEDPCGIWDDSGVPVGVGYEVRVCGVLGKGFKGVKVFVKVEFEGGGTGRGEGRVVRNTGAFEVLVDMGIMGFEGKRTGRVGVWGGGEDTGWGGRWVLGRVEGEGRIEVSGYKDKDVKEYFREWSGGQEVEGGGWKTDLERAKRKREEEEKRRLICRACTTGAHVRHTCGKAKR